MNEMMIFSNPEFGNVRTVMIDDNPWFVGIDVARALGYAKPNEAIRTNTNKEDTSIAGVSDANNHTQQMIVINESGLYDMVFDSRLPKAKEFRHWVTSDVIPSIRKTGKYEAVPKQDSYQIEDFSTPYGFSNVQTYITVKGKETFRLLLQGQGVIPL